MSEDPIVREVRAAREKHAAELGFDVKRIFEDLKRSERRRRTPLLEPPGPSVPAHAPSPSGVRFARR